MKGFVQNTAVKIIFFIMFVFLVFSLLVCGIGVVYMADSEVYSDGGQSLLDDIYGDYIYKGLSTLETMLNEKLAGNDVSGYEKKLSPNNTNLRYFAYDEENVTVAYNGNISEQIYTKEPVIRCFVPDVGTINIHYAVLENYEGVNKYMEEFGSDDKQILSTDIDEGYDGTVTLKIRYQTGMYKTVNLYVGVAKELTVKDILYYEIALAKFGIAAKEWVFAYAVAAVLLGIFLFVVLLCGAGHKKGREGVYLSWVDKIPFDLWIGLNVLAGGLIYSLLCEMRYWDIGVFIAVGLGCIVYTAMLLGLIMTFAARVKTEGWYKNTIIYIGIKWLFKAVKALFKGLYKVLSLIPLFYKSLLVLLGLTLVEFVFLCFGLREYILLWILEKLIFVPGIIYCVLCMRSLQKSARRMAKGDTEHKVETSKMIFDFKEHGENLNSLGDGLAVAVEKSVRSERMKAELITNVSHDIKTPLTSVINYVDLLKREGLDSENASEYLEVLERQTGKLKRLTEDLVEASKASAGNVAVNREELDLKVLLSQAVGEYEERMNANGLVLLLETPQEEMKVRTDGRLMWRVFDNLMNNICKYSQPNTRVYVTALDNGGKKQVVFRNISREQLNISPEELTERFVRGDRSRNTEGSGLGLSIAKSLTEVQGGALDIQIDGDLFKATVTI